MALIRSPGLVRVIARYRCFDRPASNTFYVTTPGLGIPSEVTVRDIALTYVDWETGIFAGILGYAMSRSVDSTFVWISAESCDRRGPAFLYSSSVTVNGLLPEFIRHMIATSLAPLIRWDVIRAEPKVSSRTYAIGYAVASLFGSDENGLFGLDREALKQLYNNLHSMWLMRGYQMVHPLVTKSSVQPLDYPLRLIDGVHDVSSILAVQRRRTPRRNIGIT